MNERWMLARKAEALRIRAELIQAVRLFFIDRNSLEIETPLRIREVAPESHIDAVPAGDGWFLQTSPELCMKRLLSAGYAQLFQISKCFRRDERGRRHLTEFTMLEWYRCGADYCSLMDECEDLIIYAAARLGRGTTLTFRGSSVDLSKPWERVSVAEAFSRYAPVTLEGALADECFDEIMVSRIEPELGRKRPVFLYDYPVSLGSLARKKAADPSVVERFELYLGGIELANAFSELTDVEEQRRRFTLEERHRRERGKHPYPEPAKFLGALKNMPESAGIALGMDRLAMMFTDVDAIDDVVAFVPEQM